MQRIIDGERWLIDERGGDRVHATLIFLHYFAGRRAPGPS